MRCEVCTKPAENVCYGPYVPELWFCDLHIEGHKEDCPELIWGTALIHRRSIFIDGAAEASRKVAGWPEWKKTGLRTKKK